MELFSFNPSQEAALFIVSLCVALIAGIIACAIAHWMTWSPVYFVERVLRVASGFVLVSLSLIVVYIVHRITLGQSNLTMVSSWGMVFLSAGGGVWYKKRFAEHFLVKRGFQ